MVSGAGAALGSGGRAASVSLALKEQHVPEPQGGCPGFLVQRLVGSHGNITKYTAPTSGDWALDDGWYKGEFERFSEARRGDCWATSVFKVTPASLRQHPPYHFLMLYDRIMRIAFPASRYPQPEYWY